MITITSHNRIFTLIFIALLLPAVALAQQTCQEAASQGTIHAVIDGNSAVITNDGNDTFTVSYVAYKMFAATIDDQQLADSATAELPAQSSITLNITTPTCAYQSEVVCGEPLQQSPYYGDRIIASTNGNQHAFCNQESSGSNVTVRIAPFYPQNASYVFLCEPSFNATRYDWYFGDGEIQLNSSYADVYHTYVQQGDYVVACTATGVAQGTGVLAISVNGSAGTGLPGNGSGNESQGNGSTNQTGGTDGNPAVCSVNVVSDASVQVFETNGFAQIAISPQWAFVNYSGNASWIWSTAEATHPADGEIVTFKKVFNITTLPEAAVLTITAADGYEVYLNGEFIGSAQVSGDWKNSNLTEKYVHTEGWQSTETYDVKDKLIVGENVLIAMAANEYFGPVDGQSNASPTTNPAGLLYDLQMNSACSTSGGNSSVNSTNNQTDSNHTQSNETGACGYALEFASVTNPVLVGATIAVEGILSNGSDLSGAIVQLNGNPVGVLMNQWMTSIAAPLSAGPFQIMAVYNSPCGDVSNVTSVTVVEDEARFSGSNDDGQVAHGGFYCMPGYHKFNGRCERDAQIDEEPEQNEEETEGADTEVAGTSNSSTTVVPTIPQRNQTRPINGITGNFLGSSGFASWWPLLVLALIIIALGIWYLVGSEPAPKKTAKKRRR